MGGGMQPQGHVQVLLRMVDQGRNPQAAIDAPRWQVSGTLDLALEAGFSDACADGLARRGHVVRRLGGEWFGGAQAAYRLGAAYVAASEPRKDGLAAGF